MADITSAVVLAAGHGRRLRPLTRYQPKPMVSAANRPIIEYVHVGANAVVRDAVIGSGVTVDANGAVPHGHTVASTVRDERGVT